MSPLRFRLGILLVCGGLATACTAHVPPAPSAHTPVASAPATVTTEAIVAAIASALPPLPPPAAPTGAPTEGTATARDRPIHPTTASDDPTEAALNGDGYVALAHGAFRVRIPAAESAAMAPYLHELLDRASALLAARYGATPTTVRIDYYDDRAAYRARLGGRLPFDVDGAYGDGTIVVLTPRGGAGNWGETLVHELAHAYQDEASDGRAPAWLCEGLAELDARSIRAEWTRELDAEFAAVIDGPEPSLLARIARAIERPATLRELGGAYVAATEFAAFVGTRGGSGAVAALLAAYATGASDPAAVEAATGTPLAVLERDFADALSPRLERARRAHLPELVHVLEAAPTDAAAWARRAASAMLDRQFDAARSAADAALGLDPQEPRALLVRTYLAVRAGDASAESWLARMIEGGHPAYEASIALGRVALLRGALEEAAEHARRAVDADGDRVEGWDLLLRVADRGADGIDRAAARRRIVDLDQRAGELALALVTDAAAVADEETVRRYGERLVYVMPERTELHQMLIVAYERAGDAVREERERGVLASLAQAGARPIDAHGSAH